ncbi:MAG: hypothetical protein A2Y61_07250 [Chloroflexi bacterium RBG_13_60_13]|nr:MAG: hypothetical protein A2Y61_07250 [Chloroflexi bacterium RBG_13_60_13]
MNALRPSPVDTLVVASSASLFALGCFNVAANAQAVSDDSIPHDYGYLAPPAQAAEADDALHDFRHFAPTRGIIEGTEPGYRLIDSSIIWDTIDECNLNSRMYNFCSGKSTIFEHNVVLDNWQDKYPEQYRWAMHNTDLWSDHTDYFYLDTLFGDSITEFSITFGTTHTQWLQPNEWYRVMILSEPAYPGPNWMKLQFEVGNPDKKQIGPVGISGCVLGSAWCMLWAEDRCTVFDWIHSPVKKVLPGREPWTLFDGHTCLETASED